MKPESKGERNLPDNVSTSVKCSKLRRFRNLHAVTLLGLKSEDERYIS